jgi:hypothetical protein
MAAPVLSLPHRLLSVEELRALSAMVAKKKTLSPLFEDADHFYVLVEPDTKPRAPWTLLIASTEADAKTYVAALKKGNGK